MITVFGGATIIVAALAIAKGNELKHLRESGAISDDRYNEAMQSLIEKMK